MCPPLGQGVQIQLSVGSFSFPWFRYQREQWALSSPYCWDNSALALKERCRQPPLCPLATSYLVTASPEIRLASWRTYSRKEIAPLQCMWRRRCLSSLCSPCWDPLPLSWHLCWSWGIYQTGQNDLDSCPWCVWDPHCHEFSGYCCFLRLTMYPNIGPRSTKERQEHCSFTLISPGVGQVLVFFFRFILPFSDNEKPHSYCLKFIFL